MGSAAGPRATTGVGLKAQSPNCPTGRCGIRLDGINGPVYQLWVDMVYDGGGWVMVLSNRWGTGGMRNLTYSNAVNSMNYGADSVYSNSLSGRSLNGFNAFVGVKYWYGLSQNVYAGYMTIVQFVSTSAVQLNATGSHTKRYRWRSTNFTGTYAFQSAGSVSDETSTGSPGMYSYHAANAWSLSTYDNDQDPYAGNCSTTYGNNPWWYDSCWSGNYFGYDNGVYWDGSGSDTHNYGAVYIK
jgi:hypothetical protein